MKSYKTSAAPSKTGLFILNCFVATASLHASVTSVAWYRFGEADPGAFSGAIVNITSQDSVGGNHLQRVGNPRYTNDVAIASINSTLAVQFDGSSQFLTNRAVLNGVTDNFGMEAWVRPASTNGNVPVVYNGDETAGTGWALWQKFDTYEGIWGGDILFGGTARAGSWAHVAIVRNQGTNILYFNGAQVAALGPVGPPDSPTGPITVGGASDPNYPLFYPGTVDEVRVFTFAPGQFSPNDLLINRQLAGALATTINAANRFAYGANIGWMDWRGNTNNGAVVGEFICSGSIYAANVGWINLGGGSPANGIQYQNISENDFGVNHDGSGNLRGYAYAANIGWINFENSGAPKVDLITGMMSGYAYSANCGWISLSNAFAVVQTDTIAPGALAPNGLPIAWLLQHFGTTNVLANADRDGDGMSNLQEYLAGTDPNDRNSRLVITGFATPNGGTLPALTWDSVLTRQYRIQKTFDLAAPLWIDSGLGLISPDGPSTRRDFPDIGATNAFYRVQAVKPLTP